MRKRDLLTSPSAASPAATHVKTVAVAADAASAKWLMRFALIAADPAKFPSSPEMTGPYFAVIVFRTKDNHTEQKNYAPMGRSFFAIIIVGVRG